MFRIVTSFNPYGALLLVSLAPFACSPVETMPTDVPSSPEVETVVEEAPESPFTVSQSMPKTYSPGTLFTAAFTMNYVGSEPVTALAIQLKLPLGWEFVEILEGPTPAITPKPGTIEAATLVWVTTPTFPATIRYTLKVPEWTEGTQMLEAQAIYRGLGGEEQSPVSTVSATRSG